MRGRGLFAMLLGALAIAMIGIGCGGDSGSGSGSGSNGGAGESGGPVVESSISKAQYVKQAEAVCKSNTEKLEAEFATFVKETDVNAKTLYVDLVNELVAPGISAEIEELRQIEVPKGDAAEIEKMLKARENSIAIAEKDPEAVVQNRKKVFNQSSKLAGKYGLKACAIR